MVYLNKLVTANGEAVYNLRRSANLKQKDVIREAAKMKLPITLRSYQRVEAGEDVAKKLLENVATFYSRFLPSVGWMGSINFSDIVVFNEKYSNKDFSVEKIKDPNNFEVEHGFLYKGNFNVLEKIISSSVVRKIFYDFIPTQSEKLVIKEALIGINNIKDAKKNNNKELSFESYNSLDKELERLEKLSNKSDFLEKLNAAGIDIFAGNYYYKNITTDVLDNKNKKQVDVGDPNGLHIQGDWIPSITYTNYGIFVFHKKTKMNLMHYYYNNNWYHDKLNAMINEPYKVIEKNIVDHDAYTAIMDHYRNLFNYDRYLDDNRFKYKLKIDDDLADNEFANVDFEEFED